MVFAMVMMLAFLVDQTQQLCCALFQAVWAKLGSKRLLWERMRALFYDYRLESMRELFEALGTFQKRAKVVDSLPGYTSGMAGCRHHLALGAKRSMRLSFQHARLGSFRVRLSAILH